MTRLPASFTSLYRLFLRASSASVLHKNATRKHLRQLFRPVFDAAAGTVRDLHSKELSHSERVRHERLVSTFHQRMDSTLSLLVNSAQYRGIPHRAIYNINRLRQAHALWVHGKYYSVWKNAWNPKAIAQDNSKPRVGQRRHDIYRMERNRMHERCWDAFGEAVRMAEGRHNLSLGRLYLKPWSWEKR